MIDPKSEKILLDNLRMEGKFQEAFERIKALYKDQRSARINDLLFVNSPIFWSELRAGKYRLTRRSEADAEFIRTVWSNTDFMYAFHRHASPLPQDNQKLTQLLRKEYLASFLENQSIHWIIQMLDGEKFGLLSLVNVSLAHKRAEVLLGVLPGAPKGISVASMLMLFEFYFRVMKFNKLYSQVFVDNPHSLKSTLHLGFSREGVLRRHVLDPRSKQFVDIVQTGLLADEAFSEKNKRLMERLLV